MIVIKVYRLIYILCLYRLLYTFCLKNANKDTCKNAVISVNKYSNANKLYSFYSTINPIKLHLPINLTKL